MERTPRVMIRVNYIVGGPTKGPQEGEKIMSKSLVAALEPSAPGATFAVGDVLNGASDAKLEAFAKANA